MPGHPSWHTFFFSHHNTFQPHASLPNSAISQSSVGAEVGGKVLDKLWCQFQHRHIRATVVRLDELCHILPRTLHSPKRTMHEKDDVFYAVSKDGESAVLTGCKCRSHREKVPFSQVARTKLSGACLQPNDRAPIGKQSSAYSQSIVRLQAK